MPNQPLPTPTPPPASPIVQPTPPVKPVQPLKPLPMPPSPQTATTPQVVTTPVKPLPVPPAVGPTPGPSMMPPSGMAKPVSPSAPPVSPVPPTPPNLSTPPASSVPPSLPRPPQVGGGSLPPRPPAQSPSKPPTTPGSAPKQAAVQKSPLRFLPIILAAVGIIGVLIFVISRLMGGLFTSTPSPDTTTATPTRTQVSGKQTTLTYWGLWESNAVLDQVFKDYEKANPNIKINYIQQSHKDYRERLQTAIQSGSGPDIFRFHASWVPMLRTDLATMPSSVYSLSDFQRIFYPVAAKQLTLNGQLVGVPLMYDGLALYYNVDMLRVANAQAPTTWADLKTLASQLTVRSGTQIQRGGLAIGNTSNVEHFSDILGLLLLQNGADPLNPTGKAAEDALAFYTAFYKTDKVWSEALPNSTTAFARGDVAMMFAPSWRVFEIKSMNPDLNFAIAPVPKLGDKEISWASYWAEGVNTKSANKDESWKLLKYMSSPEVMKKMHSDQSSVRAFGEVYSRTDLANELATQPLVVPFLTDAPKAQDSYLNSFTHDNGINDQIIKYYADAINAVNQSTSPADALKTVAQGVMQVLRQFGVATSTSAGAASTGTTR